MADFNENLSCYVTCDIPAMKLLELDETLGCGGSTAPYWDYLRFNAYSENKTGKTQTEWEYTKFSLPLLKDFRISVFFFFSTSLMGMSTLLID
jgi:hypothetical protein